MKKWPETLSEIRDDLNRASHRITQFTLQEGEVNATDIQRELTQAHLVLVRCYEGIRGEAKNIEELRMEARRRQAVIHAKEREVRSIQSIALECQTEIHSLAAEIAKDGNKSSTQIIGQLIDIANFLEKTQGKS